MYLLRAILFATVLTLAFAKSAVADDTNANKTLPASKKSVAQLVDPAKAAELIAAKKVIVLDVRTSAEFAAGHIGGATNLDFRDKDFKANIAKLPKDKNYLVNCAAGTRSAKACELMTTMEFKTLYDLKGGMRAWEAAGKPVAK